MHVIWTKVVPDLVSRTATTTIPNRKHSLVFRRIRFRHSVAQCLRCPPQRITINVFVCRIRLSATPESTLPYNTQYCMRNYHCNQSLFFFSLPFSSSPPHSLIFILHLHSSSSLPFPFNSTLFILSPFTSSSFLYFTSSLSSLSLSAFPLSGPFTLPSILPALLLRHLPSIHTTTATPPCNCCVTWVTIGSPPKVPFRFFSLCVIINNKT